MKYMLTWSERPQGSTAEYENAQKRILGVFRHWKVQLFVVRVGEWGGHMLVETDDAAGGGGGGSSSDGGGGGAPGAAFSVPRFAYVANIADDTVSIYTVSADLGELRHNGYVSAGDAPVAVTVDPQVDL